MVKHEIEHIKTNNIRISVVLSNNYTDIPVMVDIMKEIKVLTNCNNKTEMKNNIS